MEHKIKAYIYSCFDPKVWPELASFYDKEFGRNNYFMDLDPGAAKNISSPRVKSDMDFVLSKIKAAYALHPFEKIIIINHSNCGAYKLAGVCFDDVGEEKRFHAAELDKAKEIIGASLRQSGFARASIETRFFNKAEARFEF